MKLLAIATLFAALSSSALAASTTYQGPSASNIDGATAQNYSFSVSDPGTILSLDVAISTDADYADDVTFSLSHLGATVVFYEGNGDTESSYIDATFSDQATTATPYNGTATGLLLPANPLAAFNGLAVAGTYTLTTIDNVVPGDGTNLLSSSITVDAVPEPATWTVLLVGAGLLAGTARLRRVRAA